jgi:hypothetical protein
MAMPKLKEKKHQLIAPQEGLLTFGKDCSLRFRWSYAAIALYLSVLPPGVKAHALLNTQAALYAGCYYDALRQGLPWDMERAAELLGESENRAEISGELWKLVRAARTTVGEPEQKKSRAAEDSADASEASTTASS